MRIIAGGLKGRVLNSPKGQSTRPTSSKLRETLFNICQNYIDDAQILDLFAGSGAMGFEALSRNAAHVVFVDQDKYAFAAIKKNIEELKVVAQCTPILSDVFKALPRLNQKFDIIYADPPYGHELGHKLLELLDSTPLLKPQGRLFIEDETALTDAGLQTLKLISSRRSGKSHLSEFGLL